MPGLSHHATILPVNAIQAALEFYTNQLGFECTFQWGSPVSYAVLKREGVSIHLALQDHEVQTPKNISLYIFCEEVEQVFESFRESGVQFLEPLNTADYGMKEFIIKDPNGFKIAFGQETSS